MFLATELSEIEETVIGNWLLAMSRKYLSVYKQGYILSGENKIEETGRKKLFF